MRPPPTAPNPLPPETRRSALAIARPAGPVELGGAGSVAAATRRWVILTLFVVGGYMVFQRSFAYLAGVPGLNLFVGEVLLVAFLILHSEASVWRLLGAMIRPSPLSALAWAVFFMLVYGLILALRGFLEGYPRLPLLQELVFNIYPLYILLGLWLGERDPRLLERFMLGLSWVVGFYGVLYILWLNRVEITQPDTGLAFFLAPIGQAAALLALLAFRPKGVRMWVPFSMNLLVLLGVQSRAAYVGLLAGLLVWGVLSKRLGRLLLGAGVIASLFALALVLDLRIELTREASEYSARNVAAAILAPFDQEAAAPLSDDAGSFAGTADWRRAWWTGIWRSTHADPMRTAFGTGYGFALTSDATLTSSAPDLRTPHNWFMYSLGYGGWLGVALFATLLIPLASLLWRADHITGKVFGLPFLALAVTTGTFSNYFETPFAAIPLWVVSGMAIAPAIMMTDASGEGIVRRRRALDWSGRPRDSMRSARSERKRSARA